ncbi:MAG: chromophore lyase CpcT/CpeT [Lysobacterales bacterium]
MKRGLLMALQLAAGAGLLSAGQAVFADDAADPMARDIKVLSEWFEGEFDNEEQRWFEADRRVSIAESDRQIRVHTIHHRVHAAEFGDHVYYVEEYRDNNPAKVFRQRLVTFSTEPGNPHILMHQQFFRDKDAWLGAHEDPKKWESLSVDDVQFMSDILPEANCSVQWRRVGGQFHGAMDDRACFFGEGEKRRYSVHNLVLSEDTYWREDGSYYVSSGEHAAGNKPGAFTQMRRAKVFFCEVSFRDDQGAITQTQANIRLLSQGGTFELTRQSDSQSFTGLLRDKQYPFYSDRPDFMYFSFRKTGEPRSLVYTVHDVDSRRFGFNTQGIGAHCHREGYEFREVLSEL